MQCFYAKERGGAPSPYELFKIAAPGGAKILGCEELGSLEPGKGADLFLVDAGGLEFSGALHDPKNFLAHVGVTGPVWLTMVNGKVVYREGRLSGVDEPALAEKAEAVCGRVIRSQFPSIYL
jgi:hydroxyatrazine ethylaminohydrolase